jgi:hypothetical protein
MPWRAITVKPILRIGVRANLQKKIRRIAFTMKMSAMGFIFF